MRFGFERACIHPDRGSASLIPNSPRSCLSLYVRHNRGPVENKIAGSLVLTHEASLIYDLDAEDRLRFEQRVLPHVDAALNLARWLLRIHRKNRSVAPTSETGDVEAPTELGDKPIDAVRCT